MLYTYQSGSPASPAVVFLHGGGLSSRMWQPVIERLQVSLTSLWMLRFYKPETLAKQSARQAALKLSRLAGQVTARLVPEVGHVWALQNPDLFAATVKAWVTENPLPAGLKPLS
jgi:hypothetical protein